MKYILMMCLYAVAFSAIANDRNAAVTLIKHTRTTLIKNRAIGPVGNTTIEPVRNMIITTVGNTTITTVRGTSLTTVRDTSITLIIELSSFPPQKPDIRTAPLKYNKSFAFSFILDDALVSAFRTALPLFNGGQVSGPFTDQWGADQGGDGQYSPGLFYTDGCGHSIPFSGAIAINARAIQSAPLYSAAGNLSWPQVGQIYKAGWDILNHGYNHATGEEVKADDEVSKNTNAVNDSIHVKPRQFVVPGGKGDGISAGPYTAAAFEQGLQVVFSGYFNEKIVSLNKSTNLSQLRLGRFFLPVDESSALQSLEELSKKGEPFWTTAFTHSTGNENLWSISYPYPRFKRFFQQLADTYGKKGKDNFWMASPQAVYDYLVTNKQIRYTSALKNKNIVIRIDKASLPDGLLHNNQTFILEHGQQIRNVKCTGCQVESFSTGDAKADAIVNISWKK